MSIEDLKIRPVRADDRPWVRQVSIDHWASEVVVTKGKVYLVEELAGFVALLLGERVGLLTYHMQDDSCEILTLNSLFEKQGIGTALLSTMEKEAEATGCGRLWLITTNDNLEALGFYQKRGFSIVAVYSDAIAESRRLKPEIPLTNENGIPIKDEIELEKTLT
ncbi:MAG: GNAT family N-acetyltransferase [Candidatus Thorarchaeota archaeon]|jgi:ribosomal protein S18 acetylase RimI-like enzyme